MTGKFNCSNANVSLRKPASSWMNFAQQRNQIIAYSYHISINSQNKGRAMAQVVSRWPLTAEARVRARFNSCGICVDKVILR
jgi:hypothetical protein